MAKGLLPDMPDALDARLHQGYDPSSEFKDNSLVYSAVQYGAKPEAPEGYWEKISETLQNLKRGLSDEDPKNYFLFQDGDGHLAPPVSAPSASRGAAVGDDGKAAEDFGSSFVLPAGDAFAGRASGSGASGDGPSISLDGSSVNIVGGSPPGTTPGSGLLPPVVSASAANGNENQAIPLTISVLSPTAGSTVSILLGNVPMGAVLSAGIDNGNGTWTLTQAELIGLTLTPPQYYSGVINLSVSATASLGSETESAGGAIPVTVNGIATPPNILALDASGAEDTPIPLDITASLNDTDGSETLAVTISNVPAGATLSAGIDHGNGTWTLTPAQLVGLTLMPPAGWSGDLVLTATAISSENMTTASVSDLFTVTITGVASVPDLTVQNASGDEDTAIALDIAAALGAGASGTEILSIVIENVPTGAVLSAGIDNGNGTWTLTPAELAGLTITPPLHSDTDFNLIVRAISDDAGDLAINTEILSVTVAGVPDVPNLSVNNANGNEDTAIALNIAASLVDNDGSETLAVQISGVPAGATLSAGTDLGGGVWALTSAQLAGLTITPPQHYSGTINLTVTAIASENSQTAQNVQNLDVTVGGVADTPLLNVTDASGNEGTPIALSINAALTDTDGSESLSITISGVPAGAVLSAGIDNGDGSWTLTPGQLVGLTITPPAGSDDDFVLTVTATSSENGTTASIGDTLNVTVNAAADTPDLLVTANVTGDEDTAIPLTIAASLNDNDGSETLSLLITGFPDGTVFSAGVYAGPGRWSLAPGDLAGLTVTPPANYSGTINLTVTAIATENAGGQATISDTITVTVDPVADVPDLTVNNATGNEDAAIALDIAAALTDPSEILTVTISGVPAGAVLSAGTFLGGGVWELTSAQLAGLTITPPPDSDADFTLTVTATSEESDGSIATQNTTLDVTVTAVADVPSVTASGSAVPSNNNASITVSGTLADTDGSESLTYVIDGVPDGFALNQGHNNGDNTWTVTAAQLAGLQVIAPYDYEGTVHLRAFAVAHDNDYSSIRSAPQDFSVSFGNPLTNEINLFLGIGIAGIGIGVGVGIGINLGSLSDDYVVMEGSSVLLSDAPGLIVAILGLVSYLEFTGVPADVTFSQGTNMGGGVWRMTVAELNNLYLHLPEDNADDFTLVFQARLITLVTLPLATPDFIVVGVADAPSLSVDPASGAEDSAGIPISITAALNDTDGSEVLSLVIRDLPPGFVVNVGIDNGDGSWTIPLANINDVELIPPPNWSGDATFTVVAVSTEEEGDSSAVSVVGNISISAVADAPILSALTQSGTEDQPVLLNLGVSLADNDGSESIVAITIWDLPPGASLLNATDNGNGTWSVDPSDIGNVSFVPPPEWSGSLALSISVTSEEVANGDQATSIGSIPIHIEPVADTPFLLANDVSGSWSSPIALDLSAALNDTDGSESLSVVLSGVPLDFVLSAGLNNGDGSWTLEAGDLAGLTLSAPGDYAGGDIVLNATVYAVETGNQDTASIAQSFTVQGA